MTVCDWQPVIGAIALAIGALVPGVAGLLVALGNRQTLNRLPIKRAGDQNGGGASEGS